MIVEPRALRESYVPQELHHREGQINLLSTALRPLAEGDSGEDAFICGPSGTGKTTIAKFVLGQLERETSDVQWGYINCISNSGKAAALHKLAREAGVGLDLRRKGTHPATYLDRLQDLDQQFVAVIDEVHALADNDMLASLYEVPNVSMLLITVDENTFFSNLDSRIQSRLRGAERVKLRPYTHREMLDILRGRVKAGLKPGVVRENALDRIADLAAGDARYGITLLRRAARQVVNSDEQRYITPAVIGDIADEARDVIRDKRVDDLSSDKRLLYEIVREAGTINASELRSEYKERQGNPVASRTRRKYLRALEHYELIETYGSARGKRFQLRKG